MSFVTVHIGFSPTRKLSVTSNTWDYGNTVLISSGTHTISLISCLMAVITFLVRSIMSFGNGFYQVSEEFSFLASVWFSVYKWTCTLICNEACLGCTNGSPYCDSVEDKYADLCYKCLLQLKDKMWSVCESMLYAVLKTTCL